MNKIFFILFFTIFKLHASFCVQHPIFCQILEIKPKINKSYAFKLSNSIYKYSKKYKLDSKLFTAIIAQESMFKLDAKNCYSTKKDNSDYRCRDFGLTQINEYNIENMKIDKKRLLTDINYAVEIGAKILKFFKRYQKIDRNWWIFYNCGYKKGGSKRQVCQEYYEKVMRRYK